MTSLPYDLIQNAKCAVEGFAKKRPTPTVGIVLGSGLGNLSDKLDDALRVPYEKIPGMPRVNVAGHRGELLLGMLGGEPVACLSGRAHLYEGHSPDAVVFGVRLLAALGVSAVILTNAAGGISSECTPGKLMVITDHLNLTGKNPLLGPNESRWGPRFVDMSHTYTPSLRALALSIAQENKLPLSSGTYAGMLGPTYETPAEVRMAETMGADAVGMSTVHEAIALKHQGVPILGISCITNHAAGKSDQPLTHEDVKAVASAASESFCSLVAEMVKMMPETLRGDTASS